MGEDSPMVWKTQLHFWGDDDEDDDDDGDDEMMILVIGAAADFAECPV